MKTAGILITARSGGEERMYKRRTTELDDVALEISHEIDRKEAATRGGDSPAGGKSGGTGGTRKGRKGARKGSSKNKKKKKKHEPIRFDFRKFKFVEEVDDKYVMEYRLTRDEIMSYRKNHFHLQREPKIAVRETKSSELKEEFGTYCGVKKTIKNWLFWV